MTITKGTTPTIEYTFSEIDTADITAAILTIKQGGLTIIEKDLSSATVEQGAISWKLSQEESLSLRRNAYATVYLDYLLSDGTRVAGETETVMIAPTGKEEVISDE